MKRKKRKIIPAFLIAAVAVFMFLFFGSIARNRVTANLDKMLSNKDLWIYSHTKVYAEKQPELYNEILDMGERAIGDLMKDFVAHPEDNRRRQLVIDLVDTIVRQEGLNADTQWYASNGEWFDAVGKKLYEKYVGRVNAKVMQSAHIND